jgi:dihydroorotase-like cyclic amidohydrolase
MALFDNEFSNNTVKEIFSSAEAFAAIALLAIASDGYPSDEETKRISLMLSGMKLFSAYSTPVMDQILEKLLKILHREGFNALFETAKESLSFELRESAFAVAADIVLVNGVIAQDEQAFLNDLYHYLGLNDQVAHQIVEVMQMKNR